MEDDTILLLAAAGIGIYALSSSGILKLVNKVTTGLTTTSGLSLVSPPSPTSIQAKKEAGLPMWEQNLINVATSIPNVGIQTVINFARSAWQ